MLTRRLHIRGISRLMAALFAAQIMVAGFCLLTDDAHAMASLQSQDVQASCSKNIHADEHHAQEHSGNCFHCDQPDKLTNATAASVASHALVALALVSLPVAPMSISAVTGLLSTRTPTGPPRSSTLLYTTTQRIRV